MEYFLYALDLLVYTSREEPKQCFGRGGRTWKAIGRSVCSLRSSRLVQRWGGAREKSNANTRMSLFIIYPEPEPQEHPAQPQVKSCLGIFFLFNGFIKSVFCCQNALVRNSVAEITANINCESARRLYSCYQFMALWLCIRYARARELLALTITSHLCCCFVCFRDSDGRCRLLYCAVSQHCLPKFWAKHEGSWLVT